MNPRIFHGVLLGATLLGSAAATAAPAIAEFEVHDDMFGGALWRNDRPNNNNQRGAGCEHQTMVKLNGGKILVVCTASYTNVTPMIPGAGLSSLEAGLTPPTDAGPDGIGVNPGNSTRVQGFCASYQVDPMRGLVKTNASYFTKNNSPDWQNMHKPNATAIDGGNAAVVLYGYDPNGNRTRVNGTVLGPNCEILSQQTQLFASNNDDYGGLSVSNDSAYADAAGVTRICGGFIGNGNGTDDHHVFCVTTSKAAGTGANSYKIAPNFEISVEPNEERSRPHTMKTQLPNMMLDCWAAGNAQPPNRGVRCGLINTADGVPNAERLVWRQYVKEREGNIMYSTPSLAAIDQASGKFLFSYVKVDTTNRQGRAKARTEIQTVPMQVSMTGLTLLDEPKGNLFGIADGAHPGMTTGTYGADNRPVAFMFAGSITDGGTATTKIIGLTPEGKIDPVRALNWASASSGGHTSLWYGHNPQTPQGRSYPAPSMVLDNPGYHVTGGFQPEVKSFLLVANVHRKDHIGQCTPDPNKGTNNGSCGGKNALGLHLIPVNADAAATGGDPNDPNNPAPQDPTGGAGDTLGGCSTTGTGGMGTMLLLGLAFLTIRRRR